MIKKIRNGRKVTRINAGGPGSGRYPAGSGGDSKAQSVSEKFAHKTAVKGAGGEKGAPLKISTDREILHKIDDIGPGGKVVGSTGWKS